MRFLERESKFTDFMTQKSNPDSEDTMVESNTRRKKFLERCENLKALSEKWLALVEVVCPSLQHDCSFDTRLTPLSSSYYDEKESIAKAQLFLYFDIMIHTWMYTI